MAQPIALTPDQLAILRDARDGDALPAQLPWPLSFWPDVNVLAQRGMLTVSRDKLTPTTLGIGHLTDLDQNLEFRKSAKEAGVPGWRR